MDRIEVDAGTQTRYRILPDTDVFRPPSIPATEHPWLFPERTYECEVRLVDEEEGGYSVYVPELPGVVSEGDTYEQAISNIREALAAALRVYCDSDQPIPWDKADKPRKSDERCSWVTVDV